MVKITRHTCALCGWTWQPRDSAKKPKECPKCNRRDWDKLNQGTKVVEFSNETLLMSAIFCHGFPDSDKRYYDEVNGVSLHDALINAVNEIQGFYATEARAVIIERFGLIDGRGKTFKEIEQNNNLTRSKRERAELSGFRRLRHPSNSSKLKPYIK